MNLPSLVALSDSVRRWVVVALLVVAAGAVALAFHSWRRAGTAEDALAAANKRDELRAKGDVPVEPVPDLGKPLDEAMAGNKAFAGQVKKLQRDLPGAKPQLLVTATTGPAPLTGPPRPAPPPGTPCPTCYLGGDDRLELKLASVQLTGDDDALTGIAGGMQAWAARAGEPDPVLIFERPFLAGFTHALQAQRPERPPWPRWSLGARVWWPARDALTSMPGAIEANGGLRLFDGWWVELALRTDGERALGLRREW